MKITFIVENYYPSIGGVQSVTKYLAEGLAKKNHNVTIITTKKEFSKQEDINGVNIKRFDLKKSKLKKYSGEINEYINYILKRDDDYTIFECSENITTDLLLPYLKQIKGKKILHAHGCYGLTLKMFSVKDSLIKTIGNSYNYCYWNFYYYPIFLSKYINDFDATISLSPIDSSIKYFNKYFRREKYILGNAADDMFFDSSKVINTNYNLKYKKYFLCVANYRTIKNQIKVLKQFKKTNCQEDYELVFIGAQKNKYYEKLVKLKEKMKLKNVHILLNIPRDDIPIIMKNAFAYLVGSTYEEFSISLIEAMASGIPFISTNVGNSRLIPGGIVLKSINEMSKKMDEIVQNTNLYKELAQEAKTYSVENFKIEKCVEELIKILKLMV
jgi:glycosyltransferase involved in cell wall biosynthesis